MDPKVSDAPDGIYWMDNNSKFYWQVKLYEAKVADAPLSLTTKDVIFDTGSSLTFLPTKEYTAFINEVFKTKDCFKHAKDDMLYCKCEDSFDEGWPTVAMLMGSENSQHWFYLRGRDYLMKHRRAGEYKCSILVKEEAGQRRLSWLMGDPFLRAYYSIYDMENDRLGLVGVAETLRSPIPDEDEEGAEDYILPEPVADAVEKMSDGVKGVVETLGLDPEDT